MKELIIRKCFKCGSMIKVIADCPCDNCGIICCHESMKELKVNSTDGAIEKHKPNYTRENDKLIVTVDHVMEKDHYIEWLCLVTDNQEKYVYLNPQTEPKVIFDDVKNGKIYAYCNKHGLWVNNIE